MRMAPRSRWQTAVVVITALIGFLAACGDSSPKVPSDTSPESVHALLTGPNGNQFLRDISTYKWGAGSGRVTELFTWIPRNATSPDVQKRTTAGETAHAIAGFLADRSNDLSGDKSIGVVNPQLTQTYTDVVIPYLGAMVGDDAGTSGFQPLDGLDGPMPRTAAVFGVLRTDSTAGSRLADAVGRAADNYENQFADSAATNPTSGGADSNADLLRAARLLGLASAAGLHGSDGATFQPGDAVADLQFRIAARSVTGPNIDVPQQYFKSDGALMSPQDVRARAGEFGWEDYTGKLGAYLAKFPSLAAAVISFQHEFSTAAQSATK
jgi:hypothetical protein